MKKIKKLCVLFLFVFAFYLLATIGLRTYVSNNTSIKFFNEKYTKIDCHKGNFVPFNADNSWYETDVDFYNIFGLSFLKTDHNKNFIYLKQILGTTIYKKDSYELPEIPTADSIDELILYYEPNDENISINNRNNIDTLIDFLSTFNASDDHRNDSSIVFYAVSEDLGGVFQLNSRGSIYKKENGEIGYGAILTGDLPENIQDIIKSYITHINER